MRDNRRMRTSIDRSIRWITAFIAVVIASVASLSAHISLVEEREFWHKQTAVNYRVQISSILHQEFLNLSRDLERYAYSNVTYGFVKYTREQNLQRMFSGPHLHERNLSSILLVGPAGENIFANSIVSPRLQSLLHDRFLPIQGVPYKVNADYGLVFLEGRIFAYQHKLITNASGQSDKGSLVGFREITAEMLQQKSSEMGLEFSIQYTSAGKRVVKVSYKQDINVVIANLAQASNSMVYEFQVTYSGGQRQPASFVIYAPLNEGVPSQNVVPIAIFMFIIAAVISIWMIIRQFVIQPSLSFARMITDSEHFSKKQETERKLPLELDMVYKQFRSLYDDIDRQSRFSEQLLEAMGDVILTVNIDGDIEYANPAATKWFGFDESDLVGEPLEMYVYARGVLDSGVSSWLYRTNIEKERIETTAKLSVLNKTGVCFDCDVICQPIDLNYSVKSQSSSVVVIRPNSSKSCGVVDCAKASGGCA